MSYVADTNILLRWSQEGTRECILARDAVTKLWRRGETIFITPQNVVEFWSVATRPENVNGLGLSPETADQTAITLESLFPLLPDSASIYQVWRRLVVDERVRGVNVHDARLAAALRTHGIDRLLTFNVNHFTRFGISAVSPSDVLIASA